MKPEKVLTTTEFVLLQYKVATESHAKPFKGEVAQHKATVMDRCNNYAKLMQLPLEKWMFVPCVDGEPLRDMFMTCHESAQDFAIECIGEKDGKEWIRQSKIFLDAREHILFMGFTWDDHLKCCKFGNNQMLVIEENDLPYDNIEHAARNIELKPMSAFWKKVGL